MQADALLWSRHLANLARAAFWLLLVAIILLQLAGSRGVDRERSAALGQFERERVNDFVRLLPAVALRIVEHLGPLVSVLERVFMRVRRLRDCKARASRQHGDRC